MNLETTLKRAANGKCKQDGCSVIGFPLEQPKKKTISFSRKNMLGVRYNFATLKISTNKTCQSKLWNPFTNRF